MLLANEIEHFVTRLNQIDSEIETLKGDRKDLFDAFKDRVKPAVLKEAIKAVKLRAKLGDDVVSLDALIELLQNQE
jgi:uncharacterized protein (UPF0335 family)